MHQIDREIMERINKMFADFESSPSMVVHNKEDKKMDVKEMNEDK